MAALTIMANAPKAMETLLVVSEGDILYKTNINAVA
tara:strand:+ start:276 stop:383 length:108 start_codon:yes stop_codon:yes gene_type:complete